MLLQSGKVFGDRLTRTDYPTRSELNFDQVAVSVRSRPSRIWLLRLKCRTPEHSLTEIIPRCCRIFIQRLTMLGNVLIIAHRQSSVTSLSIMYYFSMASQAGVKKRSPPKKLSNSRCV